VAEGLGPQAGNLYVSCRDSTVVEVNIADPTRKTVIAEHGSTGDALQVDPKDNSLLVTQLDQIVRLTFPQAAAMSFLIDAHATTLAGAPFNVTVTALDAQGQVAQGYTGTVHFTSSDA